MPAQINQTRFNRDETLFMPRADRPHVYMRAWMRASCLHACLDAGLVFTCVLGCGPRVHMCAWMQASCLHACLDAGLMFTCVLGCHVASLVLLHAEP